MTITIYYQGGSYSTIFEDAFPSTVTDEIMIVTRRKSGYILAVYNFSALIHMQITYREGESKDAK